uniref:Uncharacterized protein n=1 Tax=Arundo donax TaxID=35708 RepID=A0A0A8Z772_ARUDO
MTTSNFTILPPDLTEQCTIPNKSSINLKFERKIQVMCHSIIKIHSILGM